MSQFVPFYFLNEETFTFAVIAITVYILSKYIFPSSSPSPSPSPRFLRLFLSRSFIKKVLIIFVFLIVCLEPNLPRIISNIDAKGGLLFILFFLLCLLIFFKARHLLLNIINTAGRSDCSYFILILSFFFLFLYITTMSESNLDDISLFISKCIRYDNTTIKNYYISLYWNGFLIFIPFVLNFLKLWLKKEDYLETIEIKKLLLEIIKTFVLVAFIIILVYLVVNLLFNIFTYDLLIYLIVTAWGDIELNLNNPVVLRWNNILLGKIIIHILDIISSIKENPWRWLLTKVVFILNIAYARLILISIISSIFSPESFIVELVTFSWLSYIFNSLTFYWQVLLTFFNYHSPVVEGNLIKEQLSNVDLDILNSYNPISGTWTSCKLVENNAYLKSLKIYLYNGYSSLREKFTLSLDPLRSLASRAGGRPGNINTITESKKYSFLIFFIKQYTFFGRINWNYPVVINSKPAWPKFLNSGGYYPSQFQPRSIPRFTYIYPTKEELRLKKFLDSPTLKRILYKDYLLFKKTGQLYRSWEIVRDLTAERLNLSGGVSAINSDTEPWGLRRVTLVGSLAQGKLSVVGSELDLDLVVKGGTSPYRKLPDPQLYFSPEYIQSLSSNVSLFTLGLEEDDNSSSSDSEESQEDPIKNGWSSLCSDLYEWATSLSLNLELAPKYISITNHEISSSSAMNVWEELVNTDTIPLKKIIPVDSNLVKPILGIGNNIINYPAPAALFKKLSPLAMESLEDNLVKSLGLGFLGGITNNLVYNQIIVLTSGFSSYSSYGGVFSFGGAGDDDGDDGDKNWKKHYDLLEKNRTRLRERNKFLARKRKLESSIATNDWNRVQVINELERLIQEISYQVGQLQIRLFYSIVPQEEMNYYFNLLQWYRARSEAIWRRLDDISRRNQELRRELENL